MISSQQSICIGCKTSFQQGETLLPEGIFIQYKNYYLPVRQHQQRWILLKTIIAFLNSKGGTIYMGVDDATRQVIGVNAELKQQDLFMLELDNLLQQIKPQIDLRHKQQVRVQFVPVLKDKTFQGRYIIKIIVKQGDPNKVYHFTQTLKFFNQDKRHHDEEFKVLWGFYRSNMGKVDSIKGTQLLRQVFEKAKRPSAEFKTFHQGCNPEPLRVAVRNLNIGIKNLKDSQLRQKILQFIKAKLKNLHLQSSYFIQKTLDGTIMLKFNSITQYKQADTYLLQHVGQISKFIEGSDQIIDEGVIDNTHFYRIGIPFDPKARYRKNRSPAKVEELKSQNKNKQSGFNPGIGNSSKNNNNNQRKKQSIGFTPKKKQIVQKDKVQPQIYKQQKQTKKTVFLPKKQVQSPKKIYQQKTKNNESQNTSSLYLILSKIHLDLTPEQKNQLIKAIRVEFQKVCPGKQFKVINGNLISGIINLKFQSSEQRDIFIKEVLQKLLVKCQEFGSFFIDEKVEYGSSNGTISITNYKAQQKKIFKEQVEKLFRNKQFTYNTSRYIKNNEGYYSLNLNFNLNQLSQALQILNKEVLESPISDYASSEDGIDVRVELKKIQ